MFANFGFMEIAIIVLILLILFGAKKIPELAQGIGKGMKEFKKALKDDDTNSNKKIDNKE